MKTLTVLWVIFWLSACGGSTPPADPCKGKCQSFEVCTVDGRCLADCHPECENRVCGKEPTCNTSCGECESNKECTSSGECSNTITLPEQTYSFKIDLDVLGGSTLEYNAMQCKIRSVKEEYDKKFAELRRSMTDRVMPIKKTIKANIAVLEHDQLEELKSIHSKYKELIQKERLQEKGALDAIENEHLMVKSAVEQEMNEKIQKHQDIYAVLANQLKNEKEKLLA